MVEIADIFRLHGPDYRAKFGDRMLPSHLHAMEEIEQCRTEALGGQLYFCEQCAELHYSFHSCKNRHCPKCQNDQAEAWLENQTGLLLPVNYFMVTFTLPEELRSLPSLSPENGLQPPLSCLCRCLAGVGLRPSLRRR